MFSNIEETEPRQIQVTGTLGESVVHVYNADEAETVILVHGCGGRHSQFHEGRMIQRLSAHFRVITFDLYGHGSSPACPMYRKETFLDQISAVVDAVIPPNQSFHLYGFSMGSFLAAHYCNLNPKRVRRLVLHSPWNAELCAFAPGLRAVVKMPGLGLLGCAIVRRLAFPHCHSAGTFRKILIELGEGADAWDGLLEGLMQHTCFERVLVICGEGEKPFLRVAKHLHRALQPKAHMASYPGAGHMSWCFQWDQEVGSFFRNNVSEFLIQ